MYKCVICDEKLHSSCHIVNLDETHKSHLTCFFDKVPNGLHGTERKEFMEVLRAQLINEYDKKER